MFEHHAAELTKQRADDHMCRQRRRWALYIRIKMPQRQLDLLTQRSVCVILLVRLRNRAGDTKSPSPLKGLRAEGVAALAFLLLGTLAENRSVSRRRPRPERLRMEGGHGQRREAE